MGLGCDMQTAVADLQLVKACTTAGRRYALDTFGELGDQVGQHGTQKECVTLSIARFINW
jgi:hypothetical protein